MGEEKEIKLTSHSVQRAKERVGIPKKSVERLAERVYKKGIRKEGFTGLVRKYLERIDKRSRKYDGHEIVVYGQKVWVFYSKRLITVFSIDRKYLGLMNKCRKEKKV